MTSLNDVVRRMLRKRNTTLHRLGRLRSLATGVNNLRGWGEGGWPWLAKYISLFRAHVLVTRRVIVAQVPTAWSNQIKSNLWVSVACIARLHNSDVSLPTLHYLTETVVQPVSSCVLRHRPRSAVYSSQLHTTLVARRPCVPGSKLYENATILLL